MWIYILSNSMMRRNKSKSLYREPACLPVELALEGSFLDSGRFLLQIDELDNVNARQDVDESVDMYFEF